MLTLSNKNLIANACNLSGLYFLCNDIKIDQLQYSCDVINRFNKGEQYATQLDIYRNIKPTTKGNNIYLTNILYSGVSTVIANIINFNIKENVTKYDIIRSSVYECDLIDNCFTAYGSTIDFHFDISKEQYNYIIKSMFVDSYVNLLRSNEYISYLCSIFHIPKYRINKCIQDEINRYSTVIKLPNRNVRNIKQLFLFLDQKEDIENNVSTLLRTNEIKVNV